MECILSFSNALDGTFNALYYINHICGLTIGSGFHSKPLASGGAAKRGACSYLGIRLTAWLVALTNTCLRLDSFTMITLPGLSLHVYLWLIFTENYLPLIWLHLALNITYLLSKSIHGCGPTLTVAMVICRFSLRCQLLVKWNQPLILLPLTAIPPQEVTLLPVKVSCSVA